MSGICFTEACIGCPAEVVLLAAIGAVVVYIFIGWILSKLAKEIFDNLDEILAALILILWPIAIMVGVIFGVGSILTSVIYYVGWYLIRLFGLPIYAADKDDLVKSERRLEKKIDQSSLNMIDTVDHHLEVYHPVKTARKAKKVKVSKKETKKKKAKKAKK